MTTRYLRGDAIDQLFARVGSGGTAYWTLSDRQGSVRDVVDGSGVLKDQLAYDGWGNIKSETNAAYRGRYTYTGREYDKETGLLYDRARSYDPQTGRWLSRDPLGFDAGDSNLYRYVNNGPALATDPSGLASDQPQSAAALWAQMADLQKQLNELPEGAAKRQEVMNKVIKTYKALVDMKAPPPPLATGPLSDLDQERAAQAREILAKYPPPAKGTFTPGPTRVVYELGQKVIEPVGAPPKTRQQELAEKGLREVKVPRLAGVDTDIAPNYKIVKEVVNLERESAAGRNDVIRETKVPLSDTPAFVTKLLSVGQNVGQVLMGYVLVQSGLGTASGAYMMFRGIEGLVSDFTGKEKLSTYIGRQLGGEFGAETTETILTLADIYLSLKGVRGGAASATSDEVRNASRAVTGGAAGGHQSLRVIQTSCFVAGTPLRTPEGDKPIERFRLGDWVLSRSENDPEGPVEARVVEAVFVRVAPVLRLAVGGRVIRTTAEHPFYVHGQGWKCAVELKPGDRLCSDDGRLVAVESVGEAAEVATVYNLRVAEYHTYFVGSRAWGFSVWAHNVDGCVGILDTGVPGPGRYVLTNMRGRRVLHEGQPITGATLEEAADRAIRLRNITRDDLTFGTIQLQVGRPASDANSRILGRNLEAARRPRPSEGHDAAHLVPGEDFIHRPLTVQRAIQDAREVLDSAGIGMNEARNGFWATSGHLGTHTNEYFLELGRVMRRARNEGGNAVETALNDLRARVERGEFAPNP